MFLREIEAAIILTCLASVCFAISTECPAPSTILPCTCEVKTLLYQSKAVQVTCSNVTDVGSIRKLLAFKFYNSIRLTLRNLKKKTLEKGAAQPLLVQFFFVEDSPMVESLASDSLIDMALQLEWVSFKNTSLTSIPTAALAKLHRLRYFSCLDSKITRILKKDFDGISKRLELLNLDGNPISSIEEVAFTGLSRLKSLALSKDHLKTLPAGHWLPSNSITLYLGRNGLSTIPMESFSAMENSLIHLNYNGIQRLPDEAEMVKFFFKGNTLNVQGNPLQCSCDLKWITNYKSLHESQAFEHAQLWGYCEGEGLRHEKYLQHLTAADFSDCNSTTL